MATTKEKEMKTPYLQKNGELEDEKILSAIMKAASYYEDGAISEARDTLADIVISIDEWEKFWNERGGY